MKKQKTKKIKRSSFEITSYSLPLIGEDGDVDTYMGIVREDMTTDILHRDVFNFKKPSVKKSRK